MILSALLALVVSLLESLLLYCVGKILSNSAQLRRYLGLETVENNEYSFNETSHWVERAGQVVILIAMIDAISSIVTTIVLLARM